VTNELVAFRDLGGETLVDVTPPDLGRNPQLLANISRDTGVNIVMGMGRYREPFYEKRIWETATRALAEEFVREALEGVDGILPGIIGEIGVHGYQMSPVEERVHRAAARAQVESGLSITTHAVESTVGLVQLDVFEEEHVDLTRVAIGHCDSYPNIEYYEAILSRGAYVEFDLIRGQYERDTIQQQTLVLELIARGHLRKILLSQDVCCRENLRAYGGNGYAYILESFGPRLVNEGLTQDELDTMLVENPRDFLTGTTSG